MYLILTNNNKDEDNSPKILNDKNHQASSQKFRRLNFTILFHINTDLYCVRSAYLIPKGMIFSGDFAFFTSKKTKADISIAINISMNETFFSFKTLAEHNNFE